MSNLSLICLYLRVRNNSDSPLSGSAGWEVEEAGLQPYLMDTRFLPVALSARIQIAMALLAVGYAEFHFHMCC